MTRDPGERDLRVYTVECVNGKENKVCSIGICERVKEYTVGRELGKTGQIGKDSHEFGCKY